MLLAAARSRLPAPHVGGFVIQAVSLFKEGASADKVVKLVFAYHAATEVCVLRVITERSRTLTPAPRGID